MKKIIKTIVCLLLVIQVIGFLNSTTTKAIEGFDISNSTSITSFKINKGSSQVAPGASLSAEATYALSYQYTVSMSEQPIGENDYIVIPTNLGMYFDSINIEPTIEKDGVVIGSVSYNGSQIKIVFNENAEGLTSLSGNFLTAGSLKTKVRDDANHDVKLGDKTNNYFFAKEVVRPTPPPPNSYAQVTGVHTNINKGEGSTHKVTNTNIAPDYKYNTTNIYANLPAIDELNSEGNAEQISSAYKNSYIIDELDPEIKFNGFVACDALISFTLDNGTWRGLGIPVFDEIKQESNETFDVYKARVLAKGLQYGCYSDPNSGKQTIIVSIQTTDLKYSDVFKMSAYEWAKQNLVGASDEECQRFATQYADTDNGPIYGVQVNLALSKLNAVGFETLNNTATLYSDNNVVESSNAIMESNASAQSVVGTADKATIIFYDFHEGLSLKLDGVNFKLQKKNGSGEYVDYGSVYTTNQGVAISSSLPIGDYKVVQTSWLAGYNKTENVYKNAQEFSIATGDSPVIYVANKRNTYSVTYTKGDYGDFVDDIHNNVIYNDVLPDYSGEKDYWGINANNPKAQEGYHFTGWIEELVSNVVLDLIYTAKWDANDYTLTFNRNGGDQTELDTLNLTVKYNDQMNNTNGFPNSLDMSKENYKFMGWSLVDGSTKAIDNTTKMPAKNVRLHAIWVLSDYVVKYDLNDSITDVANPHTISDKIGLTYDEVGLIPTTNPTRAGYTFDSWEVSEGGKVTIPSISSTTNYRDLALDANTKSITLKAKWIANNDTKYKIEYYTDNGLGAYNLYKSETKRATTATTVNAPSFTINGFYLDNSVVGFVSSGVVKGDGSLVLKLFYRLNPTKVNISFNLNGHGDNSVAPVTIEKGSKVNKPIDPVDSSGFTFIGWFKDNTCKEIYDFNSRVNSSITLYAGWVNNTHLKDGQYVIEHYVVDEQGNSKLYKSEIKSGIKYGSKVNATSMIIKGYTYDSANTKNIKNGYVIPSKLLKLQLYYRKNTSYQPNTKRTSLIVINKANGGDGNRYGKGGVNSGDETNIVQYFGLLCLASFGLMVSKKSLYRKR